MLLLGGPPVPSGRQGSQAPPSNHSRARSASIPWLGGYNAKNVESRPMPLCCGRPLSRILSWVCDCNFVVASVCRTAASGDGNPLSPLLLRTIERLCSEQHAIVDQRLESFLHSSVRTPKSRSCSGALNTSACCPGFAFGAHSASWGRMWLC